MGARTRSVGARTHRGAGRCWYPARTVTYRQTHRFHALPLERLRTAIAAALPESEGQVETSEHFNPSHDVEPRTVFELTAHTPSGAKVVLMGTEPCYRVEAYLTDADWDLYETLEVTFRALGSLDDASKRWGRENARVALDQGRCDIAMEQLTRFIEYRGEKVDYAEPRLAELITQLRRLGSWPQPRPMDAVVGTWKLDDGRPGPKHATLRGSWLQIDAATVVVNGFDDSTSEHRQHRCRFDPAKVEWAHDRLVLAPRSARDEAPSVTLTRRADGGFDAKVLGCDVFPWGAEHAVERV